MTIDWAEWGPPLAVLFFGLFAGLIAAVRLKMQEDTSVASQGREQDLIQAHEAAIEALRSLELDQGKLSPEDHQRERQVLISRGAAALRELEAFRAGLPPNTQEAQVPTQDDPPRTEANAPSAPVPPTPAPVASPPAGAQPQAAVISPEWKGALTALVVVGLVAVLWQFAGNDSVDRREGASMTGNQDLGVASVEPGTRAPWVDTQVALERQLEQNPRNVAVINELTQLALSIGDPGLAMQYNQRALEVDPTNPDARVYKAVLAAFIGMSERALEELEGVLVDVPDHGVAWTYKGLVQLETGEIEASVASLERAVQLQPDAAPVKEALERARGVLRGDLPAPPPRDAAHEAAAGASPHATGASPHAAGGSPHAAGTGEVVVQGTVELSAEKASALAGTEVLYVSLRSPQGGPPLAAVRLPPGPFPLDFRVTTADAISMGGAPQPMPEVLDLTLRIDRDGNAMTREPGEPAAELKAVAKGSTGLRAVLQ